jgi:hypothetical protein
MAITLPSLPFTILPFANRYCLSRDHITGSHYSIFLSHYYAYCYRLLPFRLPLLIGYVSFVSLHYIAHVTVYRYFHGLNRALLLLIAIVIAIVGHHYYCYYIQHYITLLIAIITGYFILLFKLFHC